MLPQKLATVGDMACWRVLDDGGFSEPYFGGRVPFAAEAPQLAGRPGFGLAASCIMAIQRPAACVRT